MKSAVHIRLMTEEDAYLLDEQYSQPAGALLSLFNKHAASLVAVDENGDYCAYAIAAIGEDLAVRAFWLDTNHPARGEAATKLFSALLQKAKKLDKQHLLCDVPENGGYHHLLKEIGFEPVEDKTTPAEHVRMRKDASLAGNVKYHIERLYLDDLSTFYPQLKALESDRLDGQVPWKKKDFEQELARASCYAFGVYEDTDMVGYAVLSRKGDLLTIENCAIGEHCLDMKAATKIMCRQIQKTLEHIGDGDIQFTSRAEWFAADLKHHYGAQREIRPFDQEEESLMERMRCKLEEMTDMSWRFVTYGEGGKWVDAEQPADVKELRDYFLVPAVDLDNHKDAMAALRRYFGLEPAALRAGGKAIVPATWVREAHVAAGDNGQLDIIRPAQASVRRG